MDQGEDLDHGPDILLVMLQLVMKANSAFTSEQAKEVEQEMRSLYGGLRTRIAKRKKHPTADQRKKAFNDALTDASTEQVTAENGISRRTLYRYLKRGGD